MFGKAIAIAAIAIAAISVVSANAEPWRVPPSTKIITEPVTFHDAGATLRGTVYIPDVPKEVPAIVVLHGASEPLASTPLYEHLRYALPQIGVAVLLFDRRGTGASTGNPKVPYSTLAEDGIAGARAVRKLRNIDPKRVGYWGISQGGWLATFSAARDPQAAFAVAVSAPLVTAETQMEFAMSNQLTVLGFGKADIDDMLQARRELDGYYNGRNSRTGAVTALSKISGKSWFKLMYLPAPQSVPKTSASRSAYVWRTQMDVDSVASLSQVKVPTLFLLGDSDPWIPVQRTTELLRAASKKQPLLSYAVVADANHLMMIPPAKERMSDASPAEVAVERPQAPAYFLILAAWLQKNVLDRGDVPLWKADRRLPDRTK